MFLTPPNDFVLKTLELQFINWWNYTIIRFMAITNLSDDTLLINFEWILFTILLKIVYYGLFWFLWMTCTLD